MKNNNSDNCDCFCFYSFYLILLFIKRSSFCSLLYNLQLFNQNKWKCTGEYFKNHYYVTKIFNKLQLLKLLLQLYSLLNDVIINDFEIKTPTSIVWFVYNIVIYGNDWNTSWQNWTYRFLLWQIINENLKYFSWGWGCWLSIK